MFWKQQRSMRAVRDLTPAEVFDALLHDEIMLVDVREANEHAAERIDGSSLSPLSDLNPATLSTTPGRPVVLYCAVGRRSVTAAEACLAAGLPIMGHLAGGLRAWKAAGLPTIAG